MNIPEELFYTKDHEWIRIDEETATIGVTDYAQEELGDIIFVELPDEDTYIEAGDSVGTIEAVKTVSDIFTPLNGEIVKVNRDLEESPESINRDPYKSGWILKVRNFSKNDSKLLSASQYKNLIQ